MKIKILKEVPVKKKYRPEVGKVYEVHRTERALAFITVNGTEIGVYTGLGNRIPAEAEYVSE